MTSKDHDTGAGAGPEPNPGAAASIFQSAVGGDPACHALVIGVSHYRHLPGGGGQRATHPLAAGLTQLSAAASSALRIAEWLRDRFDAPDVGKGSIRLLLSPADGERVPLHVSVPRAVSGEVMSAVADWRRDVRAHRDNVALVYVAGHGIQLTLEGGILLLEDFADPNGLTPLSGAVDIQSVRRGTVSDPNDPRTCTPQLQFFFYDACRVVPPATMHYDALDAGITLDRPKGDSWEASWVCFGSRSRDYAFADPTRRVTLYSEALLDCLESAAPTHVDGRTVRFAELQPALEDSVNNLARWFREDQQAHLGGGGRLTVSMHRRPLAVDVDAREPARTRRVRFLVNSRLPVVVRTRNVVVGESGPREQAIKLPVGGRYDAAVPLPWGGEHVESFDVPDGADELVITVDVPVSVLRQPPQPSGGPVFESRRTSEIDCKFRFLKWTFGAFGFGDQEPRLVGYEQIDAGDIKLRFAPTPGASRSSQPLLQIDYPGGPSPVVALPLGAQHYGCEVHVRYGSSGQVDVLARPEGPASDMAGYLQTGRADYAVAAMTRRAEVLMLGKRRDPIGAAIGGYALLKLNRMDEIHDWCDNLANWFPGLPDGAVIAGAVAARRDDPRNARRWFAEAAGRGIPIFTEGISLLVAESQALGGTPGVASIADLALGADFSALCTTVLSLPNQPLPGRWLEVTAAPDAPNGWMIRG